MSRAWINSIIGCPKVPKNGKLGRLFLSSKLFGKQNQAKLQNFELACILKNKPDMYYFLTSLSILLVLGTTKLCVYNYKISRTGYVKHSVMVGVLTLEISNIVKIYHNQ